MTVLKFIIVAVLIAWTTMFVQTKPTFKDDYFDFDDQAYKALVIDFGSCYCGIDVSDILETRSRPMANFRTELFIQCNPAGEEICLNRCKNETSKLIDVLCTKKGHYKWTKESYIYNNFCAASFWSKIGKTTNNNICCHNNNSVNCTDTERVKRTVEFYNDKPAEVVFEENFIREEDGSIFIQKDLHLQNIVQHNENNMKEVIEQENIESPGMSFKRALLSITEVIDQMNDHFITNTETATEFLSHTKESGYERSNIENINDEIVSQITDFDSLTTHEHQYVYAKDGPIPENFSDMSEMELINIYINSNNEKYKSEVVAKKVEDDLETTETTTVGTEVNNAVTEVETIYRTIPYTLTVNITNYQSFTNHVPGKLNLPNYTLPEIKMSSDIPDISTITSIPDNEDTEKDNALKKKINILMKNNAQVTEVTETVTTDQYFSELFSFTKTDTTIIDTSILSDIISTVQDEETLESTLSSLSTTTFESTTLSDDDDDDDLLLKLQPQFKLNPLYFNKSKTGVTNFNNIVTAQ